MLFFYKNVINHYLLVYKYLTSCNQKGLYTQGVELKMEFLLFKDTALIYKLNLCKKFVNTENWHVYCKFICEKFKMNQVSHFFLPQIKELKNAIYMLKVYTNAFIEQKTVDVVSLDFKKNDVALRYKELYKILEGNLFNNGLI